MSGKNNCRYTKPKGHEMYILDLFLNRIYKDPESSTIFGDFSFTLKMESDRKIPKDWVNTPQSILQEYNELCKTEIELKKTSINSIYRTLDELVSKKILIRTNNNENSNVESRFYPNESLEGYIALWEHVSIHYHKQEYPKPIFGSNFNPLYSEYSKKILNRQFVLDVLRKRFVSIRIAREAYLRHPL